MIGTVVVMNVFVITDDDDDGMNATSAPYDILSAMDQQNNTGSCVMIPIFSDSDVNSYVLN
jgi:hypothetical protein